MRSFDIEAIKGPIESLRVHKQTSVHSATHKHNFVELIYIYSGRGVHNIGETAYEVSSGDLLFINYGQTHSFTSIENMKFCEVLMNIIISQEIIG